MADQAASSVYLQCSLRIGFWDGLNWPTVYSDRINFTKVEITSPEQEAEELLSNMIEDFGAALNANDKPTSAAQISLEFNTMTPDLRALVLGATRTTITQEAGQVQDEVIDTTLGGWTRLTNGFLASPGTGTEITLATAADAQVTLGDWEIDEHGIATNDKLVIDLTEGMVKPIHADAVGEGMKISYYKAAREYENYASGLAKSRFVHITGKALEKSTNKTGIIDIWRGSLSSSSTTDPVAGGYFSGSLGGKIIAPEGKPSPWNWRA